MLVRLELETRANAEATDPVRLFLLEETTASRYRRFLAMLWGFEAPVDAVMARMPELAAAVGTYGLAGKLYDDLSALGFTESQIERLPHWTIPLPENAAQMLGWIYAFERNRQLNGLIRRQLPDSVSYAASYLSTHDGRVGTRYRMLGELLDAYARELVFAGSQIVRGANDAFRAQRHWFGALTSHQLMAS
jgi:heme oxygenase